MVTAGGSLWLSVATLNRCCSGTDVDPNPAACTGPLLGVVDHATFEDTTLRLDPGDALLLHTDGVTEGRHGSDLYGEHRLMATARRVGPDPAALVDSLVREVLEFQDGTLRDDVAMVAFGPPALLTH